MCRPRYGISRSGRVAFGSVTVGAYRWAGPRRAEPTSDETRSGHIEDPCVRTGLHVRIVERCATVATVANPSLWPHPRAGPSVGTGSGSGPRSVTFAVPSSTVICTRTGGARSIEFERVVDSLNRSISSRDSPNWSAGVGSSWTRCSQLADPHVPPADQVGGQKCRGGE
jgi:hypothetical protein